MHVQTCCNEQNPERSLDTGVLISALPPIWQVALKLISLTSLCLRNHPAQTFLLLFPHLLWFPFPPAQDSLCLSILSTIQSGIKEIISLVKHMQSTIFQWDGSPHKINVTILPNDSGWSWKNGLEEWMMTLTVKHLSWKGRGSDALV